MDYIIIKRTNWWDIAKIILSPIMGIFSITAFVLLYTPAFLFYMPLYRDIIGFILWLNFIFWFYFFINAGLTYKPKEEKIEIIRNTTGFKRKK